MSKQEQAVLGGGCFWCTEAIYKRVKGVSEVESGYAGGHVENPTYQMVCNGNTGHAEVIRITFDPDVISYKALVDLFWIAHDPTTLNRQGFDKGTQYRSIILTQNEAQRKAAEQSMKEASESGEFRNPIVTEIKPLEAFYPAEDYHDDYFANNPNQPYCRTVVGPKVKHFMEQYAAEKSE